MVDDLPRVGEVGDNLDGLEVLLFDVDGTDHVGEVFFGLDDEVTDLDVVFDGFVDFDVVKGLHDILYQPPRNRRMLIIKLGNLRPDV